MVVGDRFSAVYRLSYVDDIEGHSSARGRQTSHGTVGDTPKVTIID